MRKDGVLIAGETGANDSISVFQHLAAVREHSRKPRGAADANARRGQRSLRLVIPPFPPETSGNHGNSWTFRF